MEKYVCNYLVDAVRGGRAVYVAPSLGEAMMMHNERLPEYADKVLSWVTPTGITMGFHLKQFVPYS